MKAKIIHALKVLQYHFHRKILRDDFLYPDDDDWEENFIKTALENREDPFSVPIEDEPFTLTEDMIWSKSPTFSPEEIEVITGWNNEEIII